MRRRVGEISMTTRSIGALLCGGLLLFTGSMPVGAENTIGTCTPAKVRFIGNLDYHSTSSGTPVSLGGTTVKIIQGGTSPSCVIVYFSAQAATETGPAMYLSATLDGVANAIPDVTLLV